MKFHHYSSKKEEKTIAQFQQFLAPPVITRISFRIIVKYQILLKLTPIFKRNNNTYYY